MHNRISDALLNNCTEFFSVAVNGEMEPSCIHSGHTYSFDDMPYVDKAIVAEAMRSNPEIQKGIEDMVGNNEEEMIKKFIACRYGALNTEPDIDCDGNISEPEYVPCIHRGNCKYEGKVCCTIKISDTAILSRAETEVFKLVDMEDEEIGEKLFISPYTVRKHFQNIRARTSFKNKTQMAIWAAQKGIL